MAQKATTRYSQPEIYLVFSLILIVMHAYGKTAQLTGTVVDENGNPLIGANVYLEGTILGSATDSDGQFVIEKLPRGNFTLTVSIIGYQPASQTVEISENRVYEVGTFRLQPTAIAGEPVVVTAGKYEQKVQDIPASLSTLSHEELSYRNSVTINNALEYISGVNLNRGQINIRGSSGFSQGVGSRVLFLIDGIPLLAGDTQDIVYEAVPTYLVDRIEVLKGAGSALYGSSALGGVVNVLTRSIEQTPLLHARIYGTAYSQPAFEQWKWSDRERFSNGFYVNYARKIERVGFMLGGSRDEDDSYRQNDFRKRWVGSGKLQWDISPYRQLSFFGNYMWQERGNFLYWQDLNHALQPPRDQRDDRVKTNRYYLTGNYRHIFDDKRFLTVRGIWYWNRFEDTVSSGGGNQSTSINLNGEIQYNTRAGRLFLTSGIEARHNTVESNIFGDAGNTAIAAYLQGEYPLAEKWTATLGLRFDYSNIDSVGDNNQLNPKFGVVFKPRAGSAFRAAVGTGFRAPSLAEVFTSTTAGGLQVIPNPGLAPEKSSYFEIGWNQLFGDWLMADLAAFHSRFTDLIEGTIVTTLINNTTRPVIQFQNVTRARVQGFEINLNNQLLRKKLTLNVGYTYVDPWDLDRDDFLKFRPRHLFVSNVLYRFAFLQAGVDYRFISRYDRIDELLSPVIADADQRVAAHIVDIRLAASGNVAGTPVKTSFQINNILGYNYTDLVGSLAPLRNFVLTMEVGQ